MAKKPSVLVKLVSSMGTGFFYVHKKNRRFFKKKRGE